MFVFHIDFFWTAKTCMVLLWVALLQRKGFEHPMKCIFFFLSFWSKITFDKTFSADAVIWPKIEKMYSTTFSWIKFRHVKFYDGRLLWWTLELMVIVEPLGLLQIIYASDANFSIFFLYQLVNIKSILRQKWSKL